MGFKNIVTSRKVFNLSDWLGIVGGFRSSIKVMFIFFVPMFTIWNLEKYLVTSLFSRCIELPESEKEKAELKKMEYNERKLAQIKMSLKERKKIEVSPLPGILENFRKYLVKCFKKLHFSEEDYYFKKARMRLSKELDI